MRRVNITPRKYRELFGILGVVFIVMGILLMGDLLLKFIRFTLGAVLFFVGLGMASSLWKR